MIDYFKKQFPAYYFLIAILLLSLLFFYELNHKEKVLRDALLNGTLQSSSASNSNIINNGNKNKDSNGSSQVETNTNQNVKQNEKHIVRSSVGGLIRPILMVEEAKPSQNLAGLNVSLNEIVNAGKQSGRIQSASVYVKDMENDDWIEVNDTEGYYPGSLMKLAVLITYLKKSEDDKRILDKTLTLEKSVIAPGQTYKDEVIKPAIPYKISDLLYQMIVRSDNFATLLLNRELDINDLNKLIHVLGLPKMDMHNANYTITAKDYSKFMRILYNATYLNEENSQQALSMMSHSGFKKGLMRELPENVIVAHKFGETVSGNIRELHESGIVYTGTHTYLITVMTKGLRVSDLADEISEISSKVYHYFIP